MENTVNWVYLGTWNLVVPTKGTNVAHALEKSWIDWNFIRKRENERWRPLSRRPWVSLSLHCLFQGQRRDRNVKLAYKLKYIVITSTLKSSWIRENGKHSEGSKIWETGRVKSTTTNCEFCEKQRKDLPSWHCAWLFQDPSTQQQDPFINKVSWTWMEKWICSCSVW